MKIKQHFIRDIPRYYYKEVSKSTLQQRIWTKSTTGGRDPLWNEDEPSPVKKILSFMKNFKAMCVLEIVRERVHMRKLEYSINLA